MIDRGAQESDAAAADRHAYQLPGMPEIVDMLRRAVEPLGDVPCAHEPRSLRGDLCILKRDFLCSIHSVLPG